MCLGSPPALLDFYADSRENREEGGQPTQAAWQEGLDTYGLDTRERTYGGALIIEADTGADAATIRRRYRARDGSPIKYLEIINYTRRAACTRSMCTACARPFRVFPARICASLLLAASETRATITPIRTMANDGRSRSVVELDGQVIIELFSVKYDKPRVRSCPDKY